MTIEHLQALAQVHTLSRQLLSEVLAELLPAVAQ